MGPNISSWWNDSDWIWLNSNWTLRIIGLSIFSFLHHRREFYLIWIWLARRVACKKQDWLPFASTSIALVFLWGPWCSSFYVLCVCKCFCLFAYLLLLVHVLRLVPNVVCGSGLSILDCLFCFPLTIIYNKLQFNPISNISLKYRWRQ